MGESRRGNSSYAMRMPMLSILLFGVLLPIATTQAYHCTNTATCVREIAPGSVCHGDTGHCSNPFTDGGCLVQRRLAQQQQAQGDRDDSSQSPSPAQQQQVHRPRVCHSEDPPEALLQGHCRLAHELLYQHEIRISAGNWESSLMGAWILQILLSEFLGVAATIESGTAAGRLDFYASDARLEYGTAYAWEGLERAVRVDDCRHVARSDNDDAYQECAHVLPEVWGGQQASIDRLREAFVIEPVQPNGALGQSGWYMMRFTLLAHPQLASYFGLQGSGDGRGNRAALADIFLRPTRWGDYCADASTDACQTPTGVAQRAPRNDAEGSRFHVPGLYTGYFRPTNDNNCTAHPDTCTGAFIEYPCGWSSFFVPQAHHLDIALSSSGDEPASQGYLYTEMLDILAAANVTKSNVAIAWWAPSSMYQSFLGTDAEFNRVSLPPPTQDCVEARVDPRQRCNTTLTFDQLVGEPLGSCDLSSESLRKVLSTRLFELSNDPEIPEAIQNPVFDALAAYSLTELQLGKIFDYWQHQSGPKRDYDMREAVCQWVVDNYDHVASFLPRGYPRAVENKEDTLQEPLFYVAVALSMGACVLITLVAISTFQQRKKRVIAILQVEFLGLLLTGLMLVAVGCVILALPPGQDDTSNVSCTIPVWLINLGYTIELVPLMVKISAINHLAQAALQMRRVKFHRGSLFAKVFGLCTIVVVYLTVWTVLDNPRRKNEYEVTGRINEWGENMVTVSYYCDSNSVVWGYACLAGHGILLLCASVLVFQTRKLPNDINESRVLATLVYTQFLFLLLRTVITMLGDAIPVTDLARYQAMILSVDVMATCCIYFFPKLLWEHVNEEKMDPPVPFPPPPVSRASIPSWGGWREAVFRTDKSAAHESVPAFSSAATPDSPASTGTDSVITPSDNHPTDSPIEDLPVADCPTDDQPLRPIPQSTGRLMGHKVPPSDPPNVTFFPRL
jgi:hypothetical protein